MTLFGLLIAIGIFLCGLIAGYAVSVVKDRRNPNGRFIVDMKNPEDDMFRIEFFQTFGELANQSTIKLKVTKL